MKPDFIVIHPICTRCSTSLTDDNWSPSRIKRKSHLCKSCANALNKKYRADNPERYKSYSNGWYKRHPESARDNQRRYVQKLRERVIKGYGGQCQCCGEDTYEFLAIDHINGGGTKHRKSVHHRNFYRWLIKNEFPKKEYRLLCHNCNSSFGYYGYCPHRREEIQCAQNG